MDKNTKFVVIILIASILLTVSQLTKSGALFAIAMPVLMIAWLFMGAARQGKVAKTQSIWWIISLVMMVGSLLIMLSIVKVPENITSSHLFGFPLPTGILFFAFWIGLALVSTLSYSIRFEKDHLKNEWIEEFEKKTGVKLAGVSAEKKGGAEQHATGTNK